MVDANAALSDNPEMVNQDPYGEAWFVLIAANDVADVDGLLDAVGYRAITE